jgi:4,5:9,10-diseco-3-hydroxy-5,9,17-trioxoandrosta-1(10),2-diene-4-oate hydrolase
MGAPHSGTPEGRYAPVGPTPDQDWRLHYHDLGDGPAVVFLHGSGPGASGWSNFHANAAVWTERGYRCILVDTLGYGRSSKPTDVPYSLEVLSGCVLRLLDHLGLSAVTLVGNSQGGAVAIRTALDQPDRVSRLILMAPGGLEARETYMQMRGIRSMLRCIYGPEGITAFGMRKVFEKQLFDASLVSDAVVADRTAVALTQPIHVFKTMKVDNQEDRLQELAMPVLGLWGVNDVFCPVSGAMKLATRVPNAQVILLSQCGHWVMVEHADTFNRACLDFLGST